ncbi:hypothetical protein [Bradyrhizobium genosp. P]|uniref:hypothetical protein n=1 Tax=Bradyrhizobium genosp. P TaxID=83641 RepID=UPI003CE869FD
MTVKSKGPSDATTIGRPLKTEQLGSRLGSTDTLNARSPQAPSPPDDRGEDDLEYFRRRPHLNRRIRFAIEGEFPPGAIESGRDAIVHVALARDPKTNEPGIRARAIVYSDGGRA